MANLPEENNFDSGVYEIETTDPVLGGLDGQAVAPLINLTNRTRWLYNQIASIWATLAPILSPTFTGTPAAPTPASGNSSTTIATTAFAANAAFGMITVNVAGGANVVLTAAQYGTKGIILVGALTANINVIVPNAGKWVFENATTGAFTINTKTAAGTGVQVAQGFTLDCFADGTNVLASSSAAAGAALGTAAYKSASNNANATVASVASSTSGKLAQFTDNNGTVGNGKSVSDNTKGTVASVASAASGNLAVFSDGSGTVADSGIDASSILDSDQTFTSSALGWTGPSQSLFVNHLLGQTPAFGWWKMVCNTPEHGYNAGDVIMNSYSSNTLVVTSTQIGLVISVAGIVAVDRNTFADINLTPSHWSIFLFCRTVL